MAARHVKYEFLARTLHNRFDWQSRVGAVSQLSSSLCLNGLPCVINFGVQLNPEVDLSQGIEVNERRGLARLSRCSHNAGIIATT